MKIYRFTSSNCVPCHRLAKTLETADLGVEIEVVDIDVFPDVAQSYMVRSVPTLVALGDDGTVLGSSVGMKSAERAMAYGKAFYG